MTAPIRLTTAGSQAVGRKTRRDDVATTTKIMEEGTAAEMVVVTAKRRRRCHEGHHNWEEVAKGRPQQR